MVTDYRINMFIIIISEKTYLLHCLNFDNVIALKNIIKLSLKNNDFSFRLLFNYSKTFGKSPY